MTSRTRLGAVRIVEISAIFSGGRPLAAADSVGPFGWPARAGRAKSPRPPAAAPADSQPRTSRRSMERAPFGRDLDAGGHPDDDRGGTIAAEPIYRVRPPVAIARSPCRPRAHSRGRRPTPNSLVDPLTVVLRT